MKLTIGFSPCPNDTFLFEALVNGKLDTGDLQFEPIIADVEELNRKAFAAELDITKLSYHALGFLLPQYALLDAGSALGNNCGPLLIAQRQLTPDELPTALIAIPGRYTTANFLLSLYMPDHRNRREMLFSDIEAAVSNGTVDAGLIIHENRFTFRQRGLVEIVDLGSFWERETGLPIPLGGIAIRRSLPNPVQQEVNRIVRQSVLHARQDPPSVMDYVKKYAQEMDPSVMDSHINLYVNDFTVSLGQTGRKAVEVLFKTAIERGIIPAYTENFLIN